MQKAPIDETLIEGCVSCERVGDTVRPWRLPHEDLDLFPSWPEAVSVPLSHAAQSTAGVRLRFDTDAERVECRCPAPEGTERHGFLALFDCVCGGEILQTVKWDAGLRGVAFDGLPAGQKTLEIWLPPAHRVALECLHVDNGATVKPAADRRPKWITYGSSNTQCGAAHSPARTWPAIVSRKANLDLLCLGFGGNCFMDPMVALMIRDLPADLISLKLSANYTRVPASVRMFKPAIIGFVRVIREKHPDTPIALISPFCRPCAEERDPRTSHLVGLTMREMREEVRDAVVRMKRTCDDEHLAYVDGLELFNKEDAERYLLDSVHPNADSMEFIAGRFADKVPGVMGKPT